MRRVDYYNKVLRVAIPWVVNRVATSVSLGEVCVFVSYDSSNGSKCPICGKICTGYDKRRRKWRHHDTSGNKTFVTADVPRIECPEHGVLTLKVPWAETGSGFTCSFESSVIDFIKQRSIRAVAKETRLSWNAVNGIMHRAVKRGLERRQKELYTHIGVDKVIVNASDDDYVTVVFDKITGNVIYVGDGRGKSSLSEFYKTLSDAHKNEIETIGMDMCNSYINTSLEYIPEAEKKITFDKFYVMKCIDDAVDKACRQKHKCTGRRKVKTVKYNNSQKSSAEQWQASILLNESSPLNKAIALEIKREALSLWNYSNKSLAVNDWKCWLSLVDESKIIPLKGAANLINEHLWGVVNAAVLNFDNGQVESIKSRIKMIKASNRGLRDKVRFINALYFHLAELNLYP